MTFFFTFIVFHCPGFNIDDLGAYVRKLDSGTLFLMQIAFFVTGHLLFF
jgi:hypothetical protein